VVHVVVGRLRRIVGTVLAHGKVLRIQFVYPGTTRLIDHRLSSSLAFFRIVRISILLVSKFFVRRFVSRLFQYLLEILKARITGRVFGFFKKVEEVIELDAVKVHFGNICVIIQT